MKTIVSTYMKKYLVSLQNIVSRTRFQKGRSELHNMVIKQNQYQVKRKRKEWSIYPNILLDILVKTHNSTDSLYEL